MKPAARRRVERQIGELMRSNGDNCSICGKPLAHNTKTFGGVTPAGLVALTGECCQKKLKEAVLHGLYVHPGFDVDALRADVRSAPKPAPEDAPKVVETLRRYVDAVDQVGADIFKRGGLRGSPPPVVIADTAWKRDDAAWFKANPDRSHRLRDMASDERASIFRGTEPTAPPPGHDYQVLVRQVAPGRRARIPFCRNREAPIPDVETILHALFDVVAANVEGVVTAKTIADIAAGYAKTGKKN